MKDFNQFNENRLFGDVENQMKNRLRDFVINRIKRDGFLPMWIMDPSRKKGDPPSFLETKSSNINDFEGNFKMSIGRYFSDLVKDVEKGDKSIDECVMMLFDAYFTKPPHVSIDPPPWQMRGPIKN